MIEGTVHPDKLVIHSHVNSFFISQTHERYDRSMMSTGSEGKEIFLSGNV